MRRILLLCLAPVLAVLPVFAAPPRAAAQYGDYPIPPPSTPGRVMVDIRDLGGTWYMSGREDQPCQVILSRLGDRALFINENGNKAEGYIRGNRILVPRWGNLQGRFLDDTIQWSNRSTWTR